MKLKSDHALLDVTAGRNALFAKVKGQGFGGPTGERIPVTITGHVVGAWGDDDGISREFEVVVAKVETCDLAEQVRDLKQVLRRCMPLLEEIEKAKLVGDEGCLWPVEAARDALRPS